MRYCQSYFIACYICSVQNLAICMHVHCCEDVSMPHPEIVVFIIITKKTNLLQIKVMQILWGHQAFIIIMKTKSNYKAITLEQMEFLKFSCNKYTPHCITKTIWFKSISSVQGFAIVTVNCMWHYERCFNSVIILYQNICV